MISDQTLILIAVIFILVDIFLPTDITTLIAYIVFSYLIAHNIEVPLLYQVIIGIIAWWAMVALHYYVFRKFIRRVTDKFIAPTKIESGIKVHFGKVGKLVMIDDKLLIQVEDEIYSFIEQDGRMGKHGDKATIINYSNEKLIIKLTE
jgi:membrane protein implicated in regulation of membrane protease activity